MISVHICVNIYISIGQLRSIVMFGLKRKVCPGSLLFCCRQHYSANGDIPNSKRIFYLGGRFTPLHIQRSVSFSRLMSHRGGIFGILSHLSLLFNDHVTRYESADEYLMKTISSAHLFLCSAAQTQK